MGSTPPSSSVFRPDDSGALVSVASPGNVKPGPSECAAAAALQAFVEHAAYPCVGAKAALSQSSYTLAIYESLLAREEAPTTAEDLAWFAADIAGSSDGFATFIAAFRDTTIKDDRDFERALWAYLDAMHRHDRRRFEWDPEVSADPKSHDFRFSIGGAAFFVIGMHPAASREARRFPFPALVFNPHSQFEALRDKGQFERMRSVIREREEKLEGEPNPILADHGERSEAAQYAGRPHPPGWTPPFGAAAPRCPRSDTP